MDIPFWFKLIRSWNDISRTGLTLPFIVGADAIARNADAAPEDASRLLDEMRSHDICEFTVLVMSCPNRLAPVFSVQRRLATDWPPLMPRLTEGSWGTTDDEILESLGAHAAQRISQGHLSRIGEWPDMKWCPFQPNDLEFINTVINNN